MHWLVMGKSTMGVPGARGIYGPEANLLWPRIRLPYLKNIYLSSISA